MKRLREYAISIGSSPPGSLNRLSDVSGFKVGHFTIDEIEPTRVLTGITVIDIEDVIERPVYAASYTMNGFGKPFGLSQLEELGVVETPIALTNTLSVGAVHEGIVSSVAKIRPGVTTLNPIIFECNDSKLNDISALAIKPHHVLTALENTSSEFQLGSVGAGAGMTSFGFKSGIGSSSRIVSAESLDFTVGVLVLSNYGRKEDLFRNPVEAPSILPEDGDGSIVIIVAIDLPLVPFQLKRIARHAVLALGEMGTAGYHGSGDFVLVTSTLRADPEVSTLDKVFLELPAPVYNMIYRATNDAVMESILDSMLCSPATKGHKTSVDALRIEDLWHK